MMKLPAIAVLPVLALAVLVGVGLYTFWYGRGYSYLSDDPSACVNCHIMRDNFDSWTVSAHRSATCNDCHLPHNFVGHWLIKGENGFRHSTAFTFENVQVIHIRQSSREVVEANCIRCHEPTVSMITQSGPMSCTRCHKGAGHVF